MNSWIHRIERRHGTAWRAALEVLETAIRNGQLHVGDVLPSQRLMADFMGVHTNTLNRAMQQAARRGLIAAKPGRGTTVIGHPKP